VLDGQRKPRPATLTDNQQVVYDVLRDNGPSTYSTWANLAKLQRVSIDSFKRARAELVKQGRVRQDADGRYAANISAGQWTWPD